MKRKKNTKKREREKERRICDEENILTVNTEGRPPKLNTIQTPNNFLRFLAKNYPFSASHLIKTYKNVSEEDDGGARRTSHPCAL